MITKMKKLACLVYHKDYEQFLEQLRTLGVVHIEQRPEAETDEVSDEQMQDRAAVEAKMHEADTVKQLIQQLEATGVEAKPVADPEKGRAAVRQTQELNAQLAETEHTLQALRKDEAALKPWGDFDPDMLGKLAQAGYYVHFFACPQRQYDDAWETAFHAFQIGREGDKIYFITITSQVDIEAAGQEVPASVPALGIQPAINAEPIRLPDTSLSEVRHRITAEEQKAEALHQQLCSVAKQGLNSMRALERTLRTSIQFDRVVLGTQRAAADKLMVLEGWVPQDSEQQLVDFLETQRVYYELRLARKGDNVPIKLRNNAFTRMYEVLTKMYGMPDYEEFDPTPIVAPFFTLFFAFCMGDAGYGLVLIALGFLLKKKLSKSLAGMMNLVITLGIATTLFGTVLGTFFGVSLFDVDVPEWLKEFMIVGKIGETSYDKQMLLALIIGVVHICIAMTVKAVSATVRYGFKNALSDWGWLLLVVGFVCTGGLSFMKVISEDITGWAFIVIGSVAAVGIYLLNDLHRNVFVNIGAGLWDTYNMATGLLGDVLSYIRLYALGLAGGMLGGVFNQLAFMVDDAAGPIAGPLFCGLILVFGHTLNIAMSCLSAFVHPLRLTFVEYFKNSGYDGKGQAYQPFRLPEEEQ